MNNIDPLAVELVFKFVRRQERAARRLHSEATTATRSAVNTYGVEDNWCILPYLSVRALPALLTARGYIRTCPGLGPGLVRPGP